MKKLIQILFLTSLSLNAFAQEVKDSIPKQKESKWSVGVASGITATGKIKTPSFEEVGINNVKIKYILNYDIDAQLNYTGLKHTRLSFGSNYSTLKYKLSGIGGNGILDSVLSTYYYSFWNTYLLYQYNIQVDRFSFLLGAGPQLALISNNYRDYLQLSTSRYSRNQMFTKGKMAIELKLNFLSNYQINKHLSLYFELAFIKSIKGLSETHKYFDPATGSTFIALNKYKPTYYTFNFGVHYHF